jgi:hypothetical protein
MNDVLRVAPVVAYFALGLVCAVMAFKTLTAAKYLPFQERAAGRRWDELDAPMRRLLLSYLRLSGLGFLVMAILLMIFPAAGLFTHNRFYDFAVPALGLVFCGGLFLINYALHAATQADTPWRGSLYAMTVIVAAMTMSAFN